MGDEDEGEAESVEHLENQTSKPHLFYFSSSLLSLTFLLYRQQLASRPIPTSPSSPPPPKTTKTTTAKNSKKRKPQSEDEDEEEDEFEDPSTTKKSNKIKTNSSKDQTVVSTSLGSQALPRKRRVPMQGASDLDLRSSPPNPINRNRKFEQIDEQEEDGEEVKEDLDEIGLMEEENERNSPSPRKNSSGSKVGKSSTSTVGKSKKSVKKSEIDEEEDEDDDFIDGSKKNKGKGKALDKPSKASTTLSKKKSSQKMDDVQATPMISKNKTQKESGVVDQGKKKKIKLLGGGGGISGWNAEVSKRETFFSFFVFFD